MKQTGTMPVSYAEKMSKLREEKRRRVVTAEDPKKEARNTLACENVGKRRL